MPASGRDLVTRDHGRMKKWAHVVEGEAFGAPVPGRWPGGADSFDGDGPATARRWPLWKIVYMTLMAGLLLVGAALVVFFALWFLTDSGAPLF
jgi:hypothetical protein